MDDLDEDVEVTETPESEDISSSVFKLEIHKILNSLRSEQYKILSERLSENVPMAHE